MKSVLFRRLWSAGVLLLVVAFTACGDGVITGGLAGSGNTTAIRVGNNFFTPSGSTVELNSTVTWTWNPGGVLHNVTFADGPASVDQADGTYQRMFTVAGSYPYTCTIHGVGMSGTITVQ